MKQEVVWTETALETYLNIVDFIFEKWTLTEVNSFQNNVDQLINKIINHKDICPSSKILGLKKCNIDSINSLIYTTINKQIYIITFIDNRSNHSF